MFSEQNTEEFLIFIFSLGVLYFYISLRNLFSFFQQPFPACLMVFQLGHHQDFPWKRDKKGEAWNKSQRGDCISWTFTSVFFLVLERFHCQARGEYLGNLVLSPGAAPSSQLSPGDSCSRHVSAPVTFPGKKDTPEVSSSSPGSMKTPLMQTPTFRKTTPTSRVRICGKSHRGGRDHPRALLKNTSRLICLVILESNSKLLSFHLLLCFPTQRSPGLLLRRDLSHVVFPGGTFPGKTQRLCSVPPCLGCLSWRMAPFG